MTQPERGKNLCTTWKLYKEKWLQVWGITSLLKYISQAYMCLQNKLELQGNYWDTFKALQPPVSCIIRAKMAFGHSLPWLQGYISYSLSCSFMSPSDISPNVSLFSFISLKMAASCSLCTLSRRKGEVGIASPGTRTPRSNETQSQRQVAVQTLLAAGNLWEIRQR